MKSGLQISVSHFSAEREGFEPPDPLRSTVFKTAAIDHSATSPSPPRLLWDCKGRNYFCISKFIFKKIVFFCKIVPKTVGKKKNHPLLLRNISVTSSQNLNNISIYWQYYYGSLSIISLSEKQRTPT